MFFFFRLGITLTPFKLKNHIIPERTTGEKIFTGKWGPVGTENVSPVPTKK